MKTVHSAILVVTLAASINAWGPQGHQAIASAAQPRLTGPALAAVRTLLGPTPASTMLPRGRTMAGSWKG
jgi:hypothetical protein